MKISANKVVLMTYEVEVDGQIVDQANSEKPLDYIQGTHMIIPMLEAELEGKEQGDRFDVVIPPEEAYGEYDLTRVIDIPKSSFVVNGQLREDLLEVGRFIPMFNSAGEVCNGMVVEVKEDKVTMDFNAPMAGKTLHFRGEIVGVREATEKELTEGLHGEFLPQEGCGGCHGGCHHEEGECGCGGHGECECHDGEHKEGGCGCHHDGCGCHHDEE